MKNKVDCGKGNEPERDSQDHSFPMTSFPHRDVFSACTGCILRPLFLPPSCDPAGLALSELNVIHL